VQPTPVQPVLSVSCHGIGIVVVIVTVIVIVIVSFVIVVSQAAVLVQLQNRKSFSLNFSSVCFGGKTFSLIFGIYCTASVASRSASQTV
jgi:hypothetical protein